MEDKSLVKATMQLPCSVVIVSAGDGERQGAMTATAMCYLHAERQRLYNNIRRA